MKIMGQPDSYSDMLERIFATTMITGIVCTAIVGLASPTLRALVAKIPGEADFGLLTGLRAGYVVIPLFIAAISRMIRLHDKVSDLLALRQTFDTKHILMPLAAGSGLTVTPEMRYAIASNRVKAMYAVFYPYAGFEKPVIDRQFIRTALDNWGWFWVAIEAACIVFITLMLIAAIEQWRLALLLFFVLAVLVLFAVYQWSVCKGSAARQVEAILKDAARAREIRGYFARSATPDVK